MYSFQMLNTRYIYSTVVTSVLMGKRPLTGGSAMCDFIKETATLSQRASPSATHPLVLYVSLSSSILPPARGIVSFVCSDFSYSFIHLQ
jgi:hypothetical protein